MEPSTNAVFMPLLWTRESGFYAVKKAQLLYIYSPLHRAAWPLGKELAGQLGMVSTGTYIIELSLVSRGYGKLQTQSRCIPS